MCLAGKDIGFQLSGMACFLQIPFQENSTGFGKHNPACLVPFSCDRQLIKVFLHKKVPDFQVADFLRPRTAGIHQV